MSDRRSGTELTPLLNFYRVGGICMILKENGYATLSLLKKFSTPFSTCLNKLARKIFKSRKFKETGE
jgi:hypothetical protein